MANSKRFGDLEMAALCAGGVIFVSLLYYWSTEVNSTIELLELAYGSFKFFNNPLVF